MARITKQSALEKLTKARLVEIADSFGLDIDSREKKGTFVKTLRRSRKASYERVLERLDHEELRVIANAHGLKVGDADEAVLRRIILGQEEGGEEQKPKRKRGITFERRFRDYMLEEEGFDRVKRNEHCKGKVSDRGYQVDLHGVKGSAFWKFIGIVGIAAAMLAVAAYFFPEELGEVKNAVEGTVRAFDPDLAGHALLILAVPSLGLYFWGLKNKRTHVWVECKDRKTKVKRADINKLVTDAEDVRALIGAKWKPKELWFASSSGYDHDALNFAREHNEVFRS